MVRERVYYDYPTYVKDMKDLTDKVKEFNPDTLIPIARGGLTMGHMMGEALGIRRVFSINSVHYEDTQKLNTIHISNVPDLNEAEKVVILDDIVDSGDTMVAIVDLLKKKYPHLEVKIASIFFKHDALISPDFYVKQTDDWIDFFWVVDLRK